jgi:hypothetical protein
MLSSSHLNLRRVLLIALPVVIAGVVVVWAILASATPVAFEAESGIRSGAAKTVTTSGASGGSAVQFGTEQPTPPPVSATDLATFFGSEFSSSSAFCRFSDEVASVASGVLTTSYPAGSSSPSAGKPFGGAQICEPFAVGPLRTATLSYQVRFPVGFQFVMGGKLPGIYGGIEPFSGGKHTSDGWSLRMMWRTNGAAEVYSYTSTTVGYGDEYGKGNFSWLADGQWHTVTETATLNTPGASNGSVTLAYDGTVYITQGGLAITNTSTPATGLFFSTFYGGHDASWAPTADMHIDFRNFTVTGTK